MTSTADLLLQIQAATEFTDRATPLPRVLYTLALKPGHKFGSIEEQILTLAAQFREAGSVFLPLFSCPAGEGDLRFFQAHGVDAECLDLRRFRWSVLGRLLRVVRERRINVIHWNFTSPLGNAYLWWLTLLRPSVRHYYTDHISRTPPLHGPPGRPKRWLKRLLLKRYAKVICVSRFVEDCLRKERVWPDRLATCLHFVNTARFCPDVRARRRIRMELGGEERFVVLVVGQLIAAKGIDVLIRAMAELPADTVLWVLGEGPARASFEALIAERGLAGRVRMLGHQFDVCPYMQAADCFVCPSQWAEAAGLVNLEAAACGLPVIASRVGGIPEYLDDGATGFLVEPGKVDALARSLRRLIHNRDLCRRLGEQARGLVVERFSTEARLPDVLALYREGSVSP